MEKTVRGIIKKLIEDPVTKAVLEDELNRFNSLKEVSLSSIRISSSCDIFLTEHDDALLDITGYQAKTLYIFYLIDNNGIAFQDLCKHKKKLKTIYNEVCQQKTNDEFRADAVIEGLLSRKGGISDANNKINRALKEIISENNLLQYYLITGKRKGERKIQIPKELIVIENKALLRLRI